MSSWDGIQSVLATNTLTLRAVIFVQLGFDLFFEIRSLRIAQNDLERYPPASSSQVLNYRCAPPAKVFLLCLRAYLETWPLAEVLGRWL